MRMVSANTYDKWHLYAMATEPRGLKVWVTIKGKENSYSLPGVNFDITCIFMFDTCLNILFQRLDV